MTDCERHGHPIVDGYTCPCGQRVRRQRSQPPVMTMHLDRRVWEYDPRRRRVER